MTNTITASVEFYFKGKKHHASVELNLDECMRSTGKLPALYTLLAKTINLDLYSYEYEMMQAETILFNNAKGIASEYVNKGLFDFEAFEAAWFENQLLQKLQAIAQQYLSTDDINQQPELKNALLEAYRLGKETKNT